MSHAEQLLADDEEVALLSRLLKHARRHCPKTASPEELPVVIALGELQPRLLSSRVIVEAVWRNMDRVRSYEAVTLIARLLAEAWQREPTHARRGYRLGVALAQRAIAMISEWPSVTQQFGLSLGALEAAKNVLVRMAERPGWKKGALRVAASMSALERHETLSDLVADSLAEVLHVSS